MKTFQRTALLIGEDNLNKLKNSRVAVFGAGGVGGYVLEALARSGVGEIDIIDNDAVNITNINRQICALHSTIGKYKTEVFKFRIADINPDCKVNVHTLFFMPDTPFDFSPYSYVVDAVDTVTAKIEIIRRAKLSGVPVISCMGTGNKLDPTAFKIADVSKTNTCPLARVVRRELKKSNVENVKVLYSEEEPKKVETSEGVPASIAFVPSVAGLIIASEVVKDIINI